MLEFLGTTGWAVEARTRYEEVLEFLDTTMVVLSKLALITKPSSSPMECGIPTPITDGFRIGLGINLAQRRWARDQAWA